VADRLVDGRTLGQDAGALTIVEGTMRLRPSAWLMLSGACLLGGCSGAVHQLPALTSGQLNLAQSEVQASSGPPQRRNVTDEEATHLLRTAIDRVRLAANQLCREMAIGDCRWTIRASDDRSLNATAGPDGLVVINRGIMEYAANEEEVAVAVAHEIAHHSADHQARRRQNQMVGSLIGTALIGVVSLVIPPLGIGTSLIQAATESGVNLANGLVNASYSKEQEREADWLAALILFRAGVDLDKARGMLVTMARGSGGKETGMLNTHLAGPERLAAWDEAVRHIRASNGRLPRRN
jgi:predicted Zn-dependent protease